MCGGGRGGGREGSGFTFRKIKRVQIDETGVWAVWPDKNHQMSIKVAQKWFHKKN